MFKGSFFFFFAFFRKEENSQGQMSWANKSRVPRSDSEFRENECDDVEAKASAGKIKLYVRPIFLLLFFLWRLQLTMES